MKRIGYLALAWLLVAGCDTINSADSFSGKLVSHTNCKQEWLKQTAAINNASGTCVYYNYDANNMLLQVVHQNAVFNCCPTSINASFELRGDTIFIYETEEGGDCYCVCNYDLAFELTGVQPQAYLLAITTPSYYVSPYVFYNVIDFSAEPTNTICLMVDK